MGLFDFFKRKKLVNENEELEEANLLGESLHDKTIFNFKTIKREDHMLIEIDWLKKRDQFIMIMEIHHYI